MDKRCVDIKVSIPALIRLQDLIDEHTHLVNAIQRNMQEISNVSLKINLEMKEPAD